MQGFNMGRYRPPSTLDPSLEAATSPNNARKARRLNPTATTAAQPTVRFEMPFAIWCSTCPSHSSSQLIGQGVRFNAQKKKVGNYYSTTIWSFRMKHTACGGWIEIRTDPKTSEYLVSEGARKRETGDDLAVAARVGGVVIGGSSGPGEDNEKERKRQDAFAALEGKKEEKIRAKGEAARIEDLKSLRERDWRDVDASSRKLRSAFRVGRKKREKDAASAEVLQDRMGFDIDLLEETEEDGKRAGFVDFGALDGIIDDGDAGLEAVKKPFFASAAKANGQRHGKPQTKLQTLYHEISSNTRLANDPFFTNASSNTPSATTRILPGVKRKRDLTAAVTVSSTMSTADTEDQSATVSEGTPKPLVNYDSE